VLGCESLRISEVNSKTFSGSCPFDARSQSWRNKSFSFEHDAPLRIRDYRVRTIHYHS